MKATYALAATLILTFLLGSSRVLALDLSLDISQYAHTAWTVRDGFFKGGIYTIAQTPDGYLWLGTEFGLFRFDGVRSVLWEPPVGERLPNNGVHRLLGARDGTLWIGTFSGLATWRNGKLTRHSELDGQLVTSLLEDREGTVWVGSLGTPYGRLCAVRTSSTQCYGQDGAFGKAVLSLYEDSSGNLWAGAQSGLWRWNPGPARRYTTPPMELNDLSKSDDGQLLIAMRGAGIKQLVGGKVEPYPMRGAVNSNRLLRDRDGGLWIGTVDRGLIHLHRGRIDAFSRSDGLSGDVIFSLLQDHEGNVWAATNGGLDRFREFAVPTISVKQGLSSDATQSVLATADGSVWVGTLNGLNCWKEGQITIFRKASGLADDTVQSLFQDHRGRIWVSTRHGLAYYKDGRFVAVNGLRGEEEVHFLTGDKSGNLWGSGNQGLAHFLDGRLLEQISWSRLGHHENASVLLSGGEDTGLWLGFWEGGVSYFKDGQLRTSYTAADGIGEGPVADLQLDADGALWAATEGRGLSRIKDGRIATLTNKNGLPCDEIHWSIEGDDRSLWLYTACGLVHIRRTEVDAWIADPQRSVVAMVWDAADGMTLRSAAASAYGPRVAKAADGKFWFVTGVGVQVVDAHHLTTNKLAPAVHIEQIVADHKIHWQNITATAVSNLHLPARTRDLQIDYTALSFMAPEKVHFKYMLEGQDQNWKEVINDHQAQYTNLRPRQYRFRVIASNNSGVWNDQGDTLEFSVDPAYYQTIWFRALCVAAVLLLLWVAYRLRVRQLHHEFDMALEARVGERTRIARELHDTLLQSFHGILLHLQTVSNELPGGPTKQKLDRVIDQAAHAIVEGRDAVQGLRGSTVEGNDLALAIRTLGEELAAAESGPRRPHFTVQVEGTPRNLHPIVRDEVYWTVGEALRNSFRHADANRIEAEIHYDDRQFRVRVRDDGKGIDPQHLSDDGREGHFGLRGMRERSKLLSGKLTVWSELDSGTEVELSIPGEHAYVTAREQRRSWLVKKFTGKFSRRDPELRS